VPGFAYVLKAFVVKAGHGADTLAASLESWIAAEVIAPQNLSALCQKETLSFLIGVTEESALDRI
jgi:hypothetical protein